jgi:RNA polymerase sigma factor (sigma-70 family)
LRKNGEEFQDLIRRYSRVVSSAVRRVCGSTYRRLIPDAEQEVYLALWRVVEGGKKIERPASYLYKVALRAALTLIRKHASETLIHEAPIEEAASGQSGSAATEPMLLAERAKILTECLAELPEEQARALRAYLAGHNHAEVADLFGWTESVARHRIYRGIEALKAGILRKTR